MKKLITLLMLTVLALLLCACPNEEYDGRSPIVYAIETNDLVALEALLKNGVDPDNPEGFFRNQPPVFVAASKGSAEALRLCLQYGADPDCFDEKWTSHYLLEEVFYSRMDNGVRIEKIKALMEYGADASIREGLLSELAHLEYTTDEDYNDICGLFDAFVFQGATCGYRTSKGVHTLSAAAANGHFYMLKELLPSAEGIMKDRALLYLAKYCDGRVTDNEILYLNVINCAKLLIESGADKAYTGGTDKTAYDYAVENGALRLGALIKSVG